VKRPVHLANVEEVAIRVRVESLKGGRYLGASPDVPGLVAEGRSLSETIEIAQSFARKFVESCREHGDPLPAAFRDGQSPVREFRVPVMMPCWGAWRVRQSLSVLELWVPRYSRCSSSGRRLFSPA